MKYLLDTHTALWALGEKRKLSATAKSIIDDVSVSLCVSVVSVWEVAIKVSIGKMNFSGGSDFFIEKIHRNGIELLPLKGSHIKYVESIPFHHRDPFDRVLISTALAENMTILTDDEAIQKYDISWAW
jgi:PIN domain nuclease of toxin-antitoxin system